MKRIERVIIISEENHGVIGVAVDLESAIRWLIQTDWINGSTDFWVDGKFQTAEELFGIYWREKLVDQKEDFFEGGFYFYEKDLIGAIYD